MTVHFNFQRSVPRRKLLRGAGASLALPWLTAMSPAFAGPQAESAASPRRFVAMTLTLGLVGDNLNPTQAGRDYTASPYLKPIDHLRKHYTVVSGVSHPGVTGGHRAEASILTANPAGGSGKGGNSVSIDQLMAKHLGDQTRFPSLVLGSSGSNSPSYTVNGSMIPALSSPSRLFEQLFVDDSPAERARQARRVSEGRSIMDVVSADAKRLGRTLGKSDQDRLENYYTSVRDLELRLAKREAWSQRPKPKVAARKPVDIRNNSDFIGQQRLMNDMIRLALETDSTRFVCYHLGGGGGVVPLDGVAEGYHTLSHHGRDESKLDQLEIVETEIVRAWGDFVEDLQNVKESGQTALQNTSVLMTSNLGNASSHDNRNMPVLLAGGPFRHGQHLAFDQKRNYPLPNLYVNLLQAAGLPVETFQSSTGTMRGLDMV